MGFSWWAEALKHRLGNWYNQVQASDCEIERRARDEVWRLAEQVKEGSRARSDPQWRKVASLAAEAAAAAVRARARREQRPHGPTEQIDTGEPIIQ